MYWKMHTTLVLLSLALHCLCLTTTFLVELSSVHPLPSSLESSPFYCMVEPYLFCIEPVWLQT